LSDFREYWMTYFENGDNDKYVKIGFIAQDSFESEYPLDIIPKPSFILRVELLFEFNLTMDQLCNIKALNKDMDIGSIYPRRIEDDSNIQVIEWGGIIIR